MKGGCGCETCGFFAQQIGHELRWQRWMAGGFAVVGGLVFVFFFGLVAGAW